jgi:hypothetical protein
LRFVIRENGIPEYKGRKDMFIEVGVVRKLVSITLHTMIEEAEEICRRKLPVSSGIW